MAYVLTKGAWLSFRFSSSSQGQTSVDPLQLAFANLEPDEAAAEAADAPASAPSVEAPGGATEAAAAGSIEATDAPEASAASAPQLLPRVGDVFGDCSTNAVGGCGCGGGSAERASRVSLDRKSGPPWLPLSGSLSLSFSLCVFE